MSSFSLSESNPTNQKLYQAIAEEPVVPQELLLNTVPSSISHSSDQKQFLKKTPKNSM